jgi:hypothetical protein
MLLAAGADVNAVTKVSLPATAPLFCEYGLLHQLIVFFYVKIVVGWKDEFNVGDSQRTRPGCRISAEGRS